MPGPYVDDPGRERDDEASEGVDLGSLARCLAPPGRSRRGAAGRERGQRAHRAGTLDQREEVCRRPLGPACFVTVGLEVGQLDVVERQQERCPPSRDQGARRVAAAPARPCVE